MPREKRDTKTWVAIGRRIAEDRAKLGMSQAELARRLSLLNSQTVWRYEQGRFTIPQPRLEQIAEVLNQPVERYMPLKKPKPEPMSPAELRALHERIAQAAMHAAIAGTPAAIEAFNVLVAEHHRRTGR